MPIDYESTDKIEKAKETAHLDPKKVAESRDRAAQELEFWMRVEKLTKSPEWPDVKAMFQQSKDALDVIMQGDKHIAATRLIEMRGRFQVLGDILNLDTQAAVEVISLQRKLSDLDKKMIDLKSGSRWLPKIFRKTA